jgi:baculoviral IAP repeat-containing protein 6
MSTIVRSAAVLSACLTCVENACLDAGLKRAVGTILIPAIVVSLCSERPESSGAGASGAGESAAEAREAPASVQSAALSAIRRLVNGQPANQQLVAAALLRVLRAPEGASQFALRVLVDSATMEETLHAVVRHPAGADSLLPVAVTEAAVEGVEETRLAEAGGGASVATPAARRAAAALESLKEAAASCVFDVDHATKPAGFSVADDGKSFTHSAGSFGTVPLSFHFPETGCYDVEFHISQATHPVTVGLGCLPIKVQSSYSSSASSQDSITMEGESCTLRRNGHPEKRIYASAGTLMPRLRSGSNFVLRVNMDAGRLSVAQTASGPFVPVVDHIRWLKAKPPAGAEPASAPADYPEGGGLCVYFSVALKVAISLKSVTIVTRPQVARGDAGSAEALLSGAAPVRGAFDALSSKGCASDATIAMLSVVPPVAVPSTAAVVDIKTASRARGPRFLWRDFAGHSVTSRDSAAALATAEGAGYLAAARVDALRTQMLGCLSAAGVSVPPPPTEEDVAVMNAVAAAGPGGTDVLTLSYELAWRAVEEGPAATVNGAEAPQQLTGADGSDAAEGAHQPSSAASAGAASAGAAAGLSGGGAAATQSKAPVFRAIAESGGLPSLVGLMQERLNASTGASLSAEAGLLDSSEDESSVEYVAPATASAVRSVQWSRFLGTTTRLLAVPGFGGRFVTDEACQSLFLHALCSGNAAAAAQLPQVSPDAAYEPVWNLLAPLQALLDASPPSSSLGAEIRCAVASSGAFDRLCLELGRVSESSPAKGEEWLSGVEETQEMLYRGRQRALKEHKAMESKAKRDRVGWNAGMGYGHDAEPDSTASSATSAAIAKKAAAKSSRQASVAAQILRILTATLRAPLRDGDSVADTAAERLALMAVAGPACSAMPAPLASSVAGSPLRGVLRACLNASGSQMAEQLPMYRAAFEAASALALDPRCITVLTEAVEEETALYSLVQAKSVDARSALEFDSATSVGLSTALARASSGDAQTTTEDRAEANEAAAMAAVASMSREVDTAVEAMRTWAKSEALRTKPGAGGDDDGDASAAAAASGAASASSGSSGDDLLARIQAEYVEMMAAGRFGSADFAGSDGAYRVHKYGSTMKGEESSITTKMVKRTKKDLKTLSSDLPTSWQSSVMVRYDKKRPYMLKAVIIGPDDTPYEDGIFVFDIYTGAKYPSAPPHCNIVNTGGGKHRHNPNLYAEGKVCLSLLGTWRAGSKAEEWNPKTSNIWQLLISIQGFILVKDPWANEPGLEAYIGTEKGERIARYEENGGYEILRRGTLRHAMLDMLKHPPVGFEKEVREHFRLKRSKILKMATQWLAEAQDSEKPDHPKQVAAALEELKVELAKLGPSPCDDLEETDGAAAADAAPVFEVTAGEKEKISLLRAICPDTGDHILLHVVRTTSSVEAAAEKCFSSVAIDKPGYLAAHPEILDWPTDVFAVEADAGQDEAAAASSSASDSAAAAGDSAASAGDSAAAAGDSAAAAGDSAALMACMRLDE